MTQPDGQSQGGDQQAAQGQSAPPWGSDEQFDPQKAWSLIQNLRAEKEQLKSRVLTDEQKQQLAEFQRIQDAAKSDLDKANEQLKRWQAEAERWRGTAVASTVRALAADDFADPDDAVRNVDAAAYLGADGVIDEERIKADLGKLLDAKPHYRRPEGQSSPRPPARNPAQGSSANGPGTPDPAQQFAALIKAHLGG